MVRIYRRYRIRCSNCWGDLGEGCSDECRRSSNEHSKKIDETVEALSELVREARIEEVEKALSYTTMDDLMGRREELKNNTTIPNRATKVTFKPGATRLGIYGEDNTSV